MSDQVLVQRWYTQPRHHDFPRSSLPNLPTYLGMYLTVPALPVFEEVPYRLTRWSLTIVDGVTTLKADAKSRRENKVAHKTNTTSNRLSDSSSLLFPAHGARGGRMLTSNSTNHYHLSRETGRPNRNLRTCLGRNYSIPTYRYYYKPT
ncbi:uncharacterized protein PgNI_03474 [Pyricularia grisea]|uniref:Uncharacterized protein n=1 Tax=Pyricularia grisea TaxID=148305 RepID=A0A6P8BAN6_PYRGI|nr:uncharacterized protein PgNI_03474 [Pyricularia grisea]TLD12752.1 hypothetical protein PgNI_03474 [Pyricularia grisea]